MLAKGDGALSDGAPHLTLHRRAEVIVECDGDVGDRYYLASGAIQNFGPS